MMSQKAAMSLHSFTPMLTLVNARVCRWGSMPRAASVSDNLSPFMCIRSKCTICKVRATESRLIAWWSSTHRHKIKVTRLVLSLTSALISLTRKLRRPKESRVNILIDLFLFTPFKKSLMCSFVTSASSWILSTMSSSWIWLLEPMKYPSQTNSRPFVGSQRFSSSAPKNKVSFLKSGSWFLMRLMILEESTSSDPVW